MNALDAAFEVLREADEPLHYRELTRRMLDRGLWTTKGKTPWETINSRINENYQAAITRGLIQTEGRTPAATMSSLLGTDIRQRESRGEQPRFVKWGGCSPAPSQRRLASLRRSETTTRRSARN